MKFKVNISNQKLTFKDKSIFEKWKEKHEGAFILSLKRPSRTDRQNNALHLFCEWIARALNQKSLYFKHPFKDFNLKWNKTMVKEIIWKPIQETMFNKKSTTKLSTKEVSQIAEEIMNNFSAEYAIILNFPDQFSKEEGIEPFTT